MQAALRQSGYDVALAPSGKEGLIAAWRDQPDIIILELALPDLDGKELVRKLRADARTRRKLLVGLTARSSPEETKAGREAGLDHYLLKQPDALDLLLKTLAPHRRGALAPGGTAPLQPGQLIALASARGGIGTSSLTLNLAYETARAQASRSVAVMDMALPLGTLAALVGTEPPVDLVDLTELSAAERTSPELRRATPWVAAWSLFLIPGPRDPRRASQLRAEGLGPLLQAMRASFDVTFVDLGRSLSRLSFLLFAQADAIVFLLGPDGPSAENGRRILSYLEEEGVPPERVLAVVNRPIAGEQLSGPDLARRLGRPIAAVIPHSGSHFALANSLHTPFSLRFPEETASHALRDLALRLAEKLHMASG